MTEEKLRDELYSEFTALQRKHDCPGYDCVICSTIFDGVLSVVKDQCIQKEFVICAAIKTNEGPIIRGHRHADCIRNAIERNPSLTFHGLDCQGFITSRNRYVTRGEGRRLQDAAGIPSAADGGYRGNTLFSEDLY